MLRQNDGDQPNAVEPVSTPKPTKEKTTEEQFFDIQTLLKTNEKLLDMRTLLGTDTGRTYTYFDLKPKNEHLLNLYLNQTFRLGEELDALKIMLRAAIASDDNFCERTKIQEKIIDFLDLVLKDYLKETKENLSEKKFKRLKSHLRASIQSASENNLLEKNLDHEQASLKNKNTPESTMQRKASKALEKNRVRVNIQGFAPESFPDFFSAHLTKKYLNEYTVLLKELFDNVKIGGRIFRTTQRARRELASNLEQLSMKAHDEAPDNKNFHFVDFVPLQTILNSLSISEETGVVLQKLFLHCLIKIHYEGDENSVFKIHIDGFTKAEDLKKENQLIFIKECQIKSFIDFVMTHHKSIKSKKHDDEAFFIEFKNWLIDSNSNIKKIDLADLKKLETDLPDDKSSSADTNDSSEAEEKNHSPKLKKVISPGKSKPSRKRKQKNREQSKLDINSDLNALLQAKLANYQKELSETEVKLKKSSENVIVSCESMIIFKQLKNDLCFLTKMKERVELLIDLLNSLSNHDDNHAYLVLAIHQALDNEFINLDLDHEFLKIDPKEKTPPHLRKLMTASKKLEAARVPTIAADFMLSNLPKSLQDLINDQQGLKEKYEILIKNLLNNIEETGKLMRDNTRGLADYRASVKGETPPFSFPRPAKVSPKITEVSPKVKGDGHFKLFGWSKNKTKPEKTIEEKFPDEYFDYNSLDSIIKRVIPSDKMENLRIQLKYSLTNKYLFELFSGDDEQANIREGKYKVYIHNSRVELLMICLREELSTRERKKSEKYFGKKDKNAKKTYIENLPMNEATLLLNALINGKLYGRDKLAIIIEDWHKGKLIQVANNLEERTWKKLHYNTAL